MIYNSHFIEEQSKRADPNRNNRCRICGIVTCDHKHDVKAMVEHIEKLELERDQARRQECLFQVICTCSREVVNGSEALQAAKKVAEERGWPVLFEEEVTDV